MDISDGTTVIPETVDEALEMIKELEDFMEHEMCMDEVEWCKMRRAELYDQLSVLQNKKE
jgi:hypothetical protein